MKEIQKEGKTRHIGVSNFPPSLMRQACEIAPIMTNQVEYHPFLDQSKLIEMARENKILITAYSPVARGLAAKDPTLKEIGKKYNKTGPQVALRWLIEQPEVMAIPRSKSEKHQRSNLEVFDFNLTEDDHQKIASLPKDKRQINPSFAPNWDE